VSSKASGRSLSRSANPLSNFLGVTHFDREQLQLRRLRFLHESTIKSRIGGIVRIPKRGDLGGFGISSFTKSRRFDATSPPSVVDPVTFPPGRARLATSPFSTGAPTATMTTGIVVVARLAATVAGVDAAVTMTSTLM
jgi:hypothetical protein